MHRGYPADACLRCLGQSPVSALTPAGSVREVAAGPRVSPIPGCLAAPGAQVRTQIGFLKCGFPQYVEDRSSNVPATGGRPRGLGRGRPWMLPSRAGSAHSHPRSPASCSRVRSATAESASAPLSRSMAPYRRLKNSTRQPSWTARRSCNARACWRSVKFKRIVRLAALGLSGVLPGTECDLQDVAEGLTVSEVREAAKLEQALVLGPGPDLLVIAGHAMLG